MNLLSTSIAMVILLTILLTLDKTASALLYHTAQLASTVQAHVALASISRLGCYSGKALLSQIVSRWYPSKDTQQYGWRITADDNKKLICVERYIAQRWNVGRCQNVCKAND